ncbi:MAG: DUF2878 domain-containing protein [Acidobacteriota bacterium]
MSGEPHKDPAAWPVPPTREFELQVDRSDRNRRLKTLQGVALFVIMQVGWFACVLGAAWGLPLFGPLIIVVLVILQLQFSRSWRRDLRFMLLLAVAGTVIDSLHLSLGWITFKGAVLPWLAPLWITALWLQFGAMRHALLRILYGRWVLSAALGAIAGPSAYLGGAALGAAAFEAPSWRAVAFLAVCWAVVLPVSSWLAWRETPFAATR